MFGGLLVLVVVKDALHDEDGVLHKLRVHLRQHNLQIDIMQHHQTYNKKNIIQKELE